MIATASEARAGRLWLLAPLAVSLLAGGLASIHARRSFTLAEAESVLQSHRPWHELVPVWHANVGSGVYLALLKGWLHVGSAEWVARLPSAVAVAVAAASVYALGVRLFDPKIGLAAGVLFATSAYTAGIGREADPLALAVLATTVATWLFVVANGSGRWLAWCGYGVAAAASVYIHPECALALVAHPAMLFFRRRPIGRRAVAVTAFASALSAPAVVAVLATHRHLIDPLPQPSLGDVARAAHDASGRNVLLLVLAAGGAALLAFRWTWRAEASKLALLATWATAPLAGVLILSIARPSLDPRYLAASTPAVCLLAAVGLIARLRWGVVVAAALATLAMSGVRLFQLDRSTPENWRAAVSYATAAKNDHDRIVVAPSRAISAFSFYAGRDQGSLTPGGPTVFVVVRADDDVRALAASRRAVHAPAYALRSERSFGSHLWVQEWQRTGLPAS